MKDSIKIAIHKGKEYPFARPKIPELFYQYEQYTIWGITAQIANHAVALFFQSQK